MRFRSAIVVAVTMLAATGAASAAVQASNAANPPQHEVRPAICFRSYDPYRTRISVLRACGDIILPLRHVTPLPGGGKAYDYGAYTQEVPPAHFNQLNAPDKLLQAYGMPTRRQLGAQWYSVMRHYRRSVPPVRYMVEVPTARIGRAKPKPTGQQVTNNACGSIDNPYWSGWCAYGQSFNEVTADWYEPDFVGAGCSNDGFGQWVGMGGATTGYLGQDGTTFNANGFRAHQGFIETLNNENPPSPPVAVDIGATPDYQFYASALWDSTNSWYQYYMANWQTGVSYSGHSRPVHHDGSTAEVITERPSGFSDMSDYQHFEIQDATGYWGSSGAGSGFYNLPIEPQDVTDGSTVVSQPGNMTPGSSWSVYWDHCS